MSNKATLQIDADAMTVTMITDYRDLRALGKHQAQTSKAELVAMILALQSRELMAMSTQELMARHLVMMEK